MQIPEKSLDEPVPVRRKSSSHSIIRRLSAEGVSQPTNELPVVVEDEDEEGDSDADESESEEHIRSDQFEGFSFSPERNETRDQVLPTLERPRLIPGRRRRLSVYESYNGGMDLESDKIGGSARSL